MSLFIPVFKAKAEFSSSHENTHYFLPIEYETPSRKLERPLKPWFAELLLHLLENRRYTKHTSIIIMAMLLESNRC